MAGARSNLAGTKRRLALSSRHGQRRFARRRRAPLTRRTRRARPFTRPGGRQGRQEARPALLQARSRRARRRCSVRPFALSAALTVARLGAHASLLALLDQLRTYYSKGTRLEYVTQREVLTYQNEVAQIGSSPAPALPC